MTRQPEEFQEAVKKHDLKKWKLYECSICHYPTGYNFFDDGTLIFDSGCDCVITHNTRVASWNDVANQYNIQTNHLVIKVYDDFFHFIEEE